MQPERRAARAGSGAGSRFGCTQRSGILGSVIIFLTRLGNWPWRVSSRVYRPGFPLRVIAALPLALVVPRTWKPVPRVQLYIPRRRSHERVRCSTGGSGRESKGVLVMLLRFRSVTIHRSLPCTSNNISNIPASLVGTCFPPPKRRYARVWRTFVRLRLVSHDLVRRSIGLAQVLVRERDSTSAKTPIQTLCLSAGSFSLVLGISCATLFWHLGPSRSFTDV